MNFKNYIFDLGGVIADINMQNALDGFRTLGVPENELNYASGPAAKLMQEYQLGNLTTEEFCTGIAARCKIRATSPTFQEIADAWNTIIVHIPQRKLDTLRALKQKANVYLLSNTNELHWQKCLDLWFNAGDGIYGPNHISDFFHHTFLSQDLHLEKPNPEIFKQVLREIAAFQTRGATNLTSPDSDATSPMNSATIPGIDASNTVFLDDNAANVATAQSCGISAIHVAPDYDWVRGILNSDSLDS